MVYIVHCTLYTYTVYTIHVYTYIHIRSMRNVGPFTKPTYGKCTEGYYRHLLIAPNGPGTDRQTAFLTQEREGSGWWRGGDLSFMKGVHLCQAGVYVSPYLAPAPPPPPPPTPKKPKKHGGQTVPEAGGGDQSAGI